MRRTTKIAGMLAGVGAGVVAVVWMLRDRLMGPEAMPPAPPVHPAFRVVPASSARSTAESDDLTQIRGIGPAYRTRLAEAGITRFADLAATSPETIADAAGVTETKAIEWVAQAGQLVG